LNVSVLWEGPLYWAFGGNFKKGFHNAPLFSSYSLTNPWRAQKINAFERARAGMLVFKKQKDV
jgi:hypothetical protein